ncbi:MAG: cytochrome P450 [Chloroflexi bacterium]|nr:cytochrome P450 [Chloroflexota bacterium]
MLLRARYEDAEGEEGGGMSDELVRDEAVSLYLAGHDTTATTLAYSFYLLSQNPDVEERFHAELDDVLGDRDATLDDLPNLPLTDQVITETLRLYPPFWALGRMVYEPIELGGYQVPPGVTVMVSPMITHHDPRCFDDPLAFRPERWTDEFRSELPRFAYFPFGGGPHQCIGEGFAWMEAKIALANLCRRWRADARGEAEVVHRMSLKVKGGMPMRLERRR